MRIWRFNPGPLVEHHKKKKKKDLFYFKRRVSQRQTAPIHWPTWPVYARNFLGVSHLAVRRCQRIWAVCCCFARPLAGSWMKSVVASTGIGIHMGITGATGSLTFNLPCYCADPKHFFETVQQNIQIHLIYEIENQIWNAWRISLMRKQSAGITVQHMPMMLASHKAASRILAVSLSIQLPANCQGKQQKLAQVLGSLHLWMESEAPGFSLSQCQPL